MNSVTAGPAMVAFSRSLIGKIPYSEQELAGSDANGHNWFPGMPLPDEADCSGSVIMACREVGITISNGNANELFQEFAKYHLGPNGLLLPGDVGAFMGAEDVPGFAGHTALIASYNPATRQGTIVGEYDTSEGWCELPFNRDQLTNGTNGLGVIGFYRPASTLPSPPAPPPPPPKITDVDVFITANPNGNGDYLCCWSTRSAAGIPNPAVEVQIESTGVVRHNIDTATFSYFHPEVWQAPAGA